MRVGWSANLPTVVTNIMPIWRKSLVIVCASGIDPTASRANPMNTPAKQYHKTHQQIWYAQFTRPATANVNNRPAAPTPSMIAAGTNRGSSQVPNPRGNGNARMRNGSAREEEEIDRQQHVEQTVGVPRQARSRAAHFVRLPRAHDPSNAAAYYMGCEDAHERR